MEESGVRISRRSTTFLPLRRPRIHEAGLAPLHPRVTIERRWRRRAHEIDESRHAGGHKIEVIGFGIAKVLLTDAAGAAGLVGRRGEALELLSMVRSIGPKSWYVAASAGVVHLHLGDVDGAERAWRDSLGLAKGDTVAATEMMLGWVAGERGSRT